MCTFYAKVRAYKNVQNEFKKRLQKPSNAYKSQKLCHFAFWMFYTICHKKIQKAEKLSVLPFSHSSHRIKSLEETWSWWFMMASLNTVPVCAHHHADGGARLIVWETIWNSRFFPWSNSIIDAGGRGVTENSRLHWRAYSLRPGFGMFWRYGPKRLLFELASRKSRTLGADLIF